MDEAALKILNYSNCFSPALITPLTLIDLLIN